MRRLDTYSTPVSAYGATTDRVEKDSKLGPPSLG